MNNYQKLKTEVFSQLPAGSSYDFPAFSTILRRFSVYFTYDDEDLPTIFEILNPKDKQVKKEAISKLIDEFYNSTKDEMTYDTYNDLKALYNLAYDSKGTFQLHKGKLKEILQSQTDIIENQDFVSSKVEKLAD
jgi:hypothetical protein